MNAPLRPMLLTCIAEGYDARRLSQDIMAGIIVGIVALPLAIAFAIASGVKPEQGLYTAIVAGFLISVLGGSRVQIGGPTGAFIVVVFSIVTQHGYSGLAVATIMAGIMMVILGAARMGAVIKFIPYPMTVGFTGGIALIIAATQIRDLLGLDIAQVKPDFLEKFAQYSEGIGTMNPYAAGVGAASLGIILVWPRITKKVPGSIIAIFALTTAVHAFDLPVATVGSMFGEVSSSLPPPTHPEFHRAMRHTLIAPALAIALLGSIESLLSAVVADGMTGQRHSSNTELVAQGVANIVTPIFGGIPATGAIARTATNVKSGATTPLSGIVHAVTLLLILVAFGKWAALIPMATLAAVLLVVAYNMSEWRHFVKLFRAPKSDIFVMLTTYLLTVFVDLTVAIEAGIVMSAILFMKRMASITEVRNISDELDEQYVSDKDDPLAIGKRKVPKGVEVFEIQGPFFFGVANQFKDTLSVVKQTPCVLILRMRYIPAIDATALHALEELVEKTLREGTVLMFTGVKPNPRRVLDRSGLTDKVGANRIYDNIDGALAEARMIIEGDSGRRLACRRDEESEVGRKRKG